MFDHIKQQLLNRPEDKNGYAVPANPFRGFTPYFELRGCWSRESFLRARYLRWVYMAWVVLAKKYKLAAAQTAVSSIPVYASM
jgi:hypothetical protein